MKNSARNFLILGLAVFAVGCVLSYGSGDGLDGVFLTVLIIAFFAVRFGLGYVIGKAAQRRNCGFDGWFFWGGLFGPLIVWVVYLCFVHWRPIGGQSRSWEA